MGGVGEALPSGGRQGTGAAQAQAVSSRRSAGMSTLRRCVCHTGDELLGRTSASAGWASSTSCWTCARARRYVIRSLWLCSLSASSVARRGGGGALGPAGVPSGRCRSRARRPQQPGRPQGRPRGRTPGGRSALSAPSVHEQQYTSSGTRAAVHDQRYMAVFLAGLLGRTVGMASNLSGGWSVPAACGWEPYPTVRSVGSTVRPGSASGPNYFCLGGADE